MADASTHRSSGRRSGSDTAADLSGTFAAGEGGFGGSLAMTPAAALARHVEWLEFALGAASAEERWRRERLAKATKGNRPKRTDRLAEVAAEIEELTALLTGIRDLERRATLAPTPTPTPRRRGRPPGSKNGTGKPRSTAASAATKAPAAKTPTAKGGATKAPATGRRRATAARASSPASASAARPAAHPATAKPTTSTPRRKRSTSATAG